MYSWKDGKGSNMNGPMMNPWMMMDLYSAWESSNGQWKGKSNGKGKGNWKGNGKGSGGKGKGKGDQTNVPPPPQTISADAAASQDTAKRTAGTKISVATIAEKQAISKTYALQQRKPLPTTRRKTSRARKRQRRPRRWNGSVLNATTSIRTRTFSSAREQGAKGAARRAVGKDRRRSLQGSPRTRSD